VHDEHAKTGVGILLCRQNDRAILTYNGTIDGVNREMVAARLKQARHLHIASYYLMANLRPAWPELARAAKARGMTVSLDTNWDPDEQWQGIGELAGSVDIFMPNENEARAFTGESDLDAAITRLGEKFPVAVIKLGSAGAMAICQGQISRVPGYPGVPVDTVGAGDNFDAGFLFGWLHDQPIERCLEIGCFCGSRSILARGGFAAQPNRDDLLRAFPQLPEEMRTHR
jgi:sugar/nucleoside kinase (ribokinase family)